MTSNEIKSLMALKGVNQTDIARKLGVDRSTVSGVVNLLRKSRRVQQTIADELGKKYKTLWGKAA